MRLQLGKHHNNKRFNEVTTRKMVRADITHAHNHKDSDSSATSRKPSESPPTKNDEFCAIFLLRTVPDCWHRHTSQQQQKNHLIESRTKNLIIMAIISSDLHFGVFFFPCSFFVPFSLSVVPLLSQKKAFPRFVSFRLFYTIFPAHFASTQRLVSVMYQRERH